MARRMSATRWLTACGAAGVVSLGAGGSATGAPSVRQATVRNLAQPGIESSPAQPELVLASRGTCADVLTASQIDDGSSPCAPGTWPQTGTHAWNPRLDIAAGDTVEITLAQPASQVRYSAATDGPAGGQTAPDGTHAPNKQLLGPASAQSTTDPRRWTIEVPNPMDPLIRTGTTLSLVATTADGASDYAFSLGAPRAQSYGGACGPAWYAPDDVTTSCPQAPPGHPPTPESTPAPHTAHLARTRLHVSSRRFHLAIVGLTTGVVRAKLIYHGRSAARVSKTTARRVDARLHPGVFAALRRRDSIRMKTILRACDPNSCRRSAQALRLEFRSSR